MKVKQILIALILALVEWSFEVNLSKTGNEATISAEKSHSVKTKAVKSEMQLKAANLIKVNAVLNAASSTSSSTSTSSGATAATEMLTSTQAKEKLELENYEIERANALAEFII